MPITFDIATFSAVIASTIAILGTIIGLFLWLRTEANADRRELASVQKKDREDLLTLTYGFKETLNEMRFEMKDFHNRLINIEKKP